VKFHDSSNSLLSPIFPFIRVEVFHTKSGIKNQDNWNGKKIIEVKGFDTYFSFSLTIIYSFHVNGFILHVMNFFLPDNIRSRNRCLTETDTI